ncbi:MAG: ABC transporter ATP-binding protein [Planctomycetes bacterium]|nr:ABC transporter ATP-binding protein [Planctomycetota bacterium]
MSPESTQALEARGLRHAYPTALPWRKREVLHGIDFTLETGARLGLVGPNGSGKTTLLRVLAGLEPASGGTLAVLGGDPTARGIRRRIGFLSEDAAFPRELLALEALELLAQLRGVPRPTARSRAQGLLEQVGLAAAARTPLRRFSRGMARRFGLAQALVHEPQLVLLDEPTAGLDAQGFAVFDELLAGLRARSATIVLASHLLTDLQAHCDQWMVLHEGRVAAHGAPRDLLGAERGGWMLEIEGLDAQGGEAVEHAIDEHGGTLASRSPAPSALRALYRRLSK